MLESPTKNTLTAIYVRVSTEEQAEHGYSIDAQRETLQRFCADTGRTVYKVYCDAGVSGKSISGRYALQQMMQDAEMGLFNELLTWKITRIARRNLDLLHIVDHLSKHNVTFRSYSENFETETPMGRFGLQMMGAVAELERNTILENIRLGQSQRARTGKHVTKPPIGYRLVDVPNSSSRRRERALELVPEEATVVRLIFERFASGRGLKSIANELNHDGHTTRNGNAFSICAIRDILENPFFTGQIRYNRYVNWSERRRKGKNPTPMIVEGQHPAIIDQVLWDKVQFLRERKSHTSKKRFHGNYLLTGLLRCPQCGAAMTASRTNNKAKDGSTVVRMYYSCGNFRSKGSAVCRANSVRKQDAEQYVTDRIKEVLSKPQILHAIVRSINYRKVSRVKPLQDELSAVCTRIEEVQQKRLKYVELYEMDQFDRNLFATRLEELENDFERLHARKSELESELGGDHEQPVSYETVRSLIAKFEQLLRSSSIEQQKHCYT